MRAKTIDEVIRQLDNIIGWARENHSRLVYFAALYREVTFKVKEGTANGSFDDGKWIERLDVIFANHSLEAFAQYQNNQSPTRAWQIAFEASKHWWPIVLQHLLLGMNSLGSGFRCFEK